MKSSRAVRWLLFAAMMLSISAASYAQIAVGISVRIGPPALPVYAQPICPGPGYLWTPGYWAWDDAGGYYWVPGTWVVAPVGMLWTPGYWGWGGGFYVWHAGYWGPHVGFYGGINYGFGYGGVGFLGGEWRGGSFFYNRSVTNINVVNVTNVYNRTVIVNNNRYAFNGPGGVTARATAEETRYASERRISPLATQLRQQRVASQNRAMFASANQGRPSIAATARPGEFSGRNIVAAREAGAPYRAPSMSPREARVSSQEARNANANRGPENNVRNDRPANRPNNAGSRPEANRPQNDRPQNNRPQNNAQSRPEQNRPQSRPEQNRSQSRPEQNRPQQQKPERPEAQHEGRGPGR